MQCFSGREFLYQTMYNEKNLVDENEKNISGSQ